MNKGYVTQAGEQTDKETFQQLLSKNKLKDEQYLSYSEASDEYEYYIVKKKKPQTRRGSHHQPEPMKIISETKNENKSVNESKNIGKKNLSIKSGLSRGTK